jgi:hypothetical protein
LYVPYKLQELLTVWVARHKDTSPAEMILLNETIREVGHVLYPVLPGIYEAVGMTCPDDSPSTTSTCDPHHPNRILATPNETNNHKDNQAYDSSICNATGRSARGLSSGTSIGENTMQSLKAALWKLISVLCNRPSSDKSGRIGGLVHGSNGLTVERLDLKSNALKLELSRLDGSVALEF